MEAKKPWFSKTMWLNLIGGMVSAVSIFYPHASVVSEFITANLPMIGIGWAALGMVIRLVTKDAISLVD